VYSPTPSLSQNKAAYDTWIVDDDIEDELRLLLWTFTTPRRGFGGRTCWPLDEVVGHE